MIAHIRKSDFGIQTVQEHLESVAKLSKKHGAKAGFSASAELAGLLHDMGKNTKAFSKYITDAVKETGEPLERIDHSTAGAKYLYETYYAEVPASKDETMKNFIIEIIGMVILSHHSGLQNFVQTDGSPSDYFRRILRKDLPYYDEVKYEFLSVEGNQEKVEKLLQSATKEFESYYGKVQRFLHNYKQEKVTPFLYFSMAMKFIFSCLIDADRTDARKFEDQDFSRTEFPTKEFFEKSYYHLMEAMKKLARGEEALRPINKLRTEMSEQCDKMAGEPSNIFQLSIPTGGGKTFASLRYALKHAKLMGKERIIYVVPYTTILEQNADAVRKIINDKENVLEHHSNVIDDSMIENQHDYYGQPYEKRIQLARDNWEHPIVFTTMVQFLDTFYARGTRKSRRLHNLANAVIIFDEVQSVPVKHISLFNSAVNFLHYFGNSSILLCTATQPSLATTNFPMALQENVEIVKDLPNIVQAFERVKIINKVNKEGWNAEEISGFTKKILKNVQSVLIILNTKKAVLNVFQQLKNDSNLLVFHLSTSMCPKHRKTILEEVKEQLKTSDRKIVCVSTQLIEAGVDISFQCVIRSLAGIDSIAQAAGRCNRHGKDGKGMVYIIRAKEESLSKLKEIKLGQEVTELDIFSRKELAKELLSPLAIQTYFDYYLAKANNKINLQNKKLHVELVELINHCSKYISAIPVNQKRTLMTSMFKTLEENFQVIEAPTKAVLVPYGEGKELIKYFNEDISDYKELNTKLKKAQQYSVNVYPHTLLELAAEGLLVSLYNDSIYALKDGGYHEEYGLENEGDGVLSEQIF